MEKDDGRIQAIEKQLEALIEQGSNNIALQGVTPWKVLLNCLQQQNTVEAVKLVKKFGGFLKNSTESDVKVCIGILSRMFVIVDSKGALCRTIASILHGLPVHHHQYIIDTLKEALLGQLNSNTTLVTQYSVGKVNLIGAFMENFSLGEKCLDSCLQSVLGFLTNILQKLHVLTRSSCSSANQTTLMQQCLATIKTIMAVIQKFSSSITVELKQTCSDCRESIEIFMGLTWSTLSDDVFFADCQSAAGMAVALVMKILASDHHTLAIQVSRILTNGENSHPPADDQHLAQMLTKCERLTCIKSTDFTNLAASSQLYLCHGFLAMFGTKDLLQLVESRACLLTDVVLPKVFQLTESLNDSSTTLAISRTLTLWTTVALAAINEQPENRLLTNSLVGSSPIPQKFIQYVWTNWDHPVDGMRHQMKRIFENVITLHRKAASTDSTSDPILLKLLQDLIGVSWHVRGKYGPLGCLAQHLSTEIILGLYPTMHHTLMDMLGDQTLVPYVCDLLARLFTNHLKELMLSLQGQDWTGLRTWQDTWVLPALAILCDPTKHKKHKVFLVEYYLPKLLKFNPESLVYIVDHLQQQPSQLASSNVTSDQLGALLTCLKTARALGLIKAQNKKGDKEDMWKGLVSVSVLEQALCHCDPQVQLNAFGLLCNSNKTTEQFSEVELGLLHRFLSLNTSNPSPADRQQMCSHIKKMLIRLRESGRVLSRTTYKQNNSSDVDDTNHGVSVISVYKNFVSWFCEFQFINLEPGACYPRRATALHILSLIVQILNSPNPQGKHQSLFNTQDMWTPGHVQLLLMRLTDNYESNKVMAFDLLNGLSQETLGLLDRTQLDAMYSCSLELACSNKPHNPESASYILRVLSNQLQQPLKMAATSHEQCIMGVLEDLCGLLQGQISIARESLLEASVQGPMYGVLHCIREVSRDVDLNSVVSSSDWRAMLQTVIALCFQVAQLASVVVCNSSPEGYLPNHNTNVIVSGEDNNVSPSESREAQHVTYSEDAKGSVEDTTLHVTPQMVLVCCWRSMKEVALLLGQLILNAPICDAKDAEFQSESQGLISMKQIVEVGELFLQLLKESKHKGAFELAYVGFVKLCTKLWRSNTPSLHKLPQQWLEDLMEDVTLDQPQLCVTRRSAGIPFAIQALLNSEPARFNKQHFKSVMIRLLNLSLTDASDGCQTSSTSQVHALNILSALYRDTHHGEDVFPYVANGVKAAILGFQAQLWAVRNSATRLFSALITRIFGVKRGKEELARKNCMTGREFFSRFPALHGFLLCQLKEAAQKIDSSATAYLHPALFPVLLLLSRLYPSAMDGTDSSLSMAAFVPHVLRCAGSAVFKTRCIGARALVAGVPRGKVPGMLKQLIETLPQNLMKLVSSEASVGHNFIHGVLLQIHCLLVSHLQGSSHFSSNTEMHTSIASILPHLNNCLWLATRDNPCYVTRSTMLSVLNTFILDQSWMSTPSICPKPVEESLLQVKIRLYSIVISNLTSTLDDVRDAKQPGYIEWQVAYAQTTLKLVQDKDVLENQMDVMVSSDEMVCGHGLEQELGGSGEMPDSERYHAVSRGDFEDDASICNSIHTSKTKCEIKSRKLEDIINSIVLGLLSSVHYEVRELTLGALLDDNIHSYGNISVGQSIGTGKTELWSKIIQSYQVFHTLVTIITGGEDHPACIEKALLLLTHHPLCLRFPWLLPCGNSLWCRDVFDKILEIASVVNQRDEIVCAAIRMTSSLIPVLYDKIKEEKNEGVSKSIQDWTNLLECYSQAEQSIQSRSTIAKTLGQLAKIVLVDSYQLFGFQITSRLWWIVMQLLQDDDTEVQNETCHCIKQAMTALPAQTLPAILQMDFQSSLAIEVGLAVMTKIYMNTFPNQYLQTLIDWLLGARDGEQCTMGREYAQVDDGNEQVIKDRLFDRGEANTNYETLLFGKAILKELQTLAAITTCADQTKTVDTAADYDNDRMQRTNGTTGSKEMTTGKKELLPILRKAVEFGSVSIHKNPAASHTGSIWSLLLPSDINPTNSHSLGTIVRGMVVKSLLALERFLENMSEMGIITKAFLDTMHYETSCVKCWCLLAALVGLCSFPSGLDEITRNSRLTTLQMLQPLIDVFGGTRQCNPLILNIVGELREL